MTNTLINARVTGLENQLKTTSEDQDQRTKELQEEKTNHKEALNAVVGETARNWIKSLVGKMKQAGIGANTRALSVCKIFPAKRQYGTCQNMQRNDAVPENLMNYFVPGRL